MNMIRMDVPKKKLTEFCRSRHIRWMACFGSVVRDDFGPDSDVDLLVEFAPHHIPGWEIVEIEEDLSALLGGRKVDVINPKYLNRRLKDRVLAEAEVLYAEGWYPDLGDTLLNSWMQRLGMVSREFPNSVAYERRDVVYAPPRQKI
jgi:predicted nucleotidyltransferase